MRPILTKSLLCCVAFLMSGQASFADAATGKAVKTRGEVYCYPAKGVPKMVSRLESIEDKRRNIVNVNIDPKFLIKDGGVWPEAFYLAQDGEVITDLPVSREDGRVPNFIEAINAAPESEICVLDPTRADRPEDDEGLYFEMGLSPFFQTTTGEHNIAEIKEGSRDAKSFYKKMIPAGLRMFMPDTNYLAVKYQDPKYLKPEATPKIFARVDDKDIALEFERHREMFIVSGQDLHKLGASALIIRGGDYDLMPVPSPSVMRRFGWGKDANVENETQEMRALNDYQEKTEN